MCGIADWGSSPFLLTFKQECLLCTLEPGLFVITHYRRKPCGDQVRVLASCHLFSMHADLFIFQNIVQCKEVHVTSDIKSFFQFIYFLVFIANLFMSLKHSIHYWSNSPVSTLAFFVVWIVWWWCVVWLSMVRQPVKIFEYLLEQLHFWEMFHII